MTAPTITRNRRNESAEPHEAANITGQTCAELDRLGVRVSPSKVSRLVHRWAGSSVRVEFGAFLASALVLDAEQRARVARELRVISYPDPTGERAVAHVKRERGY